jgi:hypothetical protein
VVCHAAGADAVLQVALGQHDPKSHSRDRAEPVQQQSCEETLGPEAE